MLWKPIWKHVRITALPWRLDQDCLDTLRIPSPFSFDHPLVHKVLVKKNFKVALALRVYVLTSNVAKDVCIGKEDPIEVIDPLYVVVRAEQKTSVLCFESPEVCHLYLQNSGGALQ